MKRFAYVVSLALIASSCGSSSSTAPTPPPAAATKIINVSGNLAFGNVNLGSSADRTFTISNSGNATLTYTSFSCTGGSGPTGYTASPTSGTVAPGATTTVNVHFAPTTAGFLSCVLNVVGDQTGGGAAINVSGTGVNPNPIFVQSGIGDNVFNLPSYVTRMRVDATFQGACQNFIVHVVNGGSTNFLINVIIGTCSVATTSSPFSGTYAIAGGGQVQISNSTGVAWTFTELR